MCFVADGKRAQVELTLPWPPSVNNAYRALGRGRVVKTKVAREYFSGIAALVQAKRIPSFGKSRLKILIRCHPPDRRRRDLGKLDKVLMDTLEHSGLFEDDSQIDNLHYVRRPPSPPGFVEVIMRRLEMDEQAPEKPEEGEKCNGCGFCCTAERCDLAVLAIGDGPGPCPLMIFKDDRFWCGLVIYEKEEGLEPFVQTALGIGEGCYAGDLGTDTTVNPPGKIGCGAKPIRKGRLC